MPAARKPKIQFPVIMVLEPKRTKPRGEGWYKAAVWKENHLPPTTQYLPVLKDTHLQLRFGTYILWGKS